MKLILLGPPGAGKGTQAEIIGKKLSIPTISTGNILREAVKNSTSIGLNARSFMESGALVPDDVIIGIVRKRLSEPDCKNGFILDGVPRTIPQAEALSSVGADIDVVLEIQASDERIIARMAGRRICSGCGSIYHLKTKVPKKENVCDNCGGELILRHDDAPGTVKNRLAVYHQITEPIIEYYKARGKLKTVVDTTIEATAAEIAKVLRI